MNDDNNIKIKIIVVCSERGMEAEKSVGIFLCFFKTP